MNAQVKKNTAADDAMPNENAQGSVPDKELQIDKLTACEEQIARLEAQVQALTAENAALRDFAIKLNAYREMVQNGSVVPPRLVSQNGVLSIVP